MGNKVKKLIIAGLVLIIAGAALFMSQLWLSLFSVEIFSKLITTICVLGAALIFGGLLYHEYQSNINDKDKNLLGS